MEPNIRGYGISSAMQFVLDDPEVRARVPPALVEEISRTAPTFKPTVWYPRSEVIKVYRAIAGAASDEAGAYALLVRSGRKTAEGAISGYMKLLFKILTPRMFAGKFGDFWARDQQSGRAEVGFPGDNRLLFRLKDVGGYDHIGPASAGFIGYAIEAIGMKDVTLSCKPWSLAEPGPNDVDIEVAWK